MTALVDLPEIKFVDDDVSATLNNLITVFEGLTGRALAPADPVRLFLHSIAAIIVQQKALMNDTRKQGLLRYARDAVLDHMGVFTETNRLEESAAITTIRYTLSAPQLSAINIPAGTRTATATDPKLYFSTTEPVEIPPGEMTVDVTAACTETGIVGNGYLPGQINQIVDLIAFVSTAVNLTSSSGGSDVEDDAAYRERIRTAPESLSTAGPEDGYRNAAKRASPAIVDVSVTSPGPGEVLIVPLLRGGEIPTPDVLDAVFDACDDKRTRPLTDMVTVAAPTTQAITVQFTYYISRDRSSDVAAIQAAVGQATDDYILWQKSKLGRDVNPSELIRRVTMAGAYRITLISPVYAAVDATKIAVAGTPTVTYGGLVDD